MFWNQKKTKIDLVEELHTRILPVIQSWDKASGIYAISLYVYDKQDNPCEPTVTLGYNTEADYQAAQSQTSSQLEARWNYAFWQQNTAYIFGESGESAALMQNWLKQERLPYFSYDEIFSSDIAARIPEAEFTRITTQFVEMLVLLIQKLHASGVIQQKFGLELPILVHELEYYDAIAEQNVRANGQSLVKDFVSFIENPC